jgi:hypothetical protein
VRRTLAVQWLLVILAFSACWVSKRPIAGDREFTASKESEPHGWTGFEPTYQSGQAKRENQRKAALLDAGTEVAPTR